MEWIRIGDGAIATKGFIRSWINHLNQSHSKTSQQKARSFIRSKTFKGQQQMLKWVLEALDNAVANGYREEILATPTQEMARDVIDNYIAVHIQEELEPEEVAKIEVWVAKWKVENRDYRPMLRKGDE